MVHEGANQISTSGVIPSYTYLVIYLIKPLSMHQIIDQILERSTSTVTEDRESFMSMLKDDEDGSSLNMVGFKYSLLDPLTYQRMEHPVRSLHCRHVKCFDLRAFVELYSNKEKMECPVCYEAVRLDELKEDVFVWSILKHTTKDEEEVELELSGEWHHCPIQLTPPPSPPHNPISNGHSELSSSSRFGRDYNSVSDQSKQYPNSNQSKLAISTANTSFDFILDEFCPNRRKRKSLTSPSIDTFFANKRGSRSQETDLASPLSLGSGLFVKSNSGVSSMKWGNDKSSMKSNPEIPLLKLNTGIPLKSNSDKPSNPDIIDLCDDSSDEQTCNNIEDCVISLVDCVLCFENTPSFRRIYSKLSPTRRNRIFQSQYSIY